MKWRNGESIKRENINNHLRREMKAKRNQRGVVREEMRKGRGRREKRNNEILK